MTPERLLRERAPAYLVRDFVETREGLLFAVVAQGLEDGRVLGFLRYVRCGVTLHKLNTAAANQLLRGQHVEYLYHSPQRDTVLHGVPTGRIERHYRPSERLAEIRNLPHPLGLEEKTCRLGGLLGGPAGAPPWLGVTGSLLVGAQQAESDIDLVCYGRDHFAVARQRLQTAIDEGVLGELPAALWRDAYQRRGCSLTFEEYLWHERRKRNKFAYAGTKIDLSLIDAEPPGVNVRGTKLQQAVIQGLVVQDVYAFDYPACYSIQHASIREVVCYTPTYSGQARVGETLEASGWVEQADDGVQRLIVGTSREAVGEYVKVLSSDL
ncbi:MAG: hypothetical protein ACYC3X_22450 [Pirellulaceae bacterium]